MAEALTMLSKVRATPTQCKTPVYKPKQYPWGMITPTRKGLFTAFTARRLLIHELDSSDTVDGDEQSDTQRITDGRLLSQISDNSEERIFPRDLMPKKSHASLQLPQSPHHLTSRAASGSVPQDQSTPGQSPRGELPGRVQTPRHPTLRSLSDSVPPQQSPRGPHSPHHLTLHTMNGSVARDRSPGRMHTPRHPTVRTSCGSALYGQSPHGPHSPQLLISPTLTDSLSQSVQNHHQESTNICTIGNEGSRGEGRTPLPVRKNASVQCDLPTITYNVCSRRADFKFFTGISKETFEDIYLFIGGDEVCYHIKYRKRDGTPKKPRMSVLSPKERLFMTLVRLRRGIPLRDLAVIFGITLSFASTIVYTWIRFLSLQFQGLLKRMFVSAEVQNVNKFSIVQRWPNLRAIIDCAEFRIQKSSNFQMQSNTWSSYKSDNTIKYLFAMSCYTGASMVSRGFEGSMSDKEVVIESGFLDYLAPGDVVMCDRGFDIEAELNELGVDIVIPAFLGTRDALTAGETSKSAEVSSARIFVEILIKSVKDFRILRGKIPNKLVPVMDDMVNICTVLSQFDKPVIRRETLTLSNRVADDVEAANSSLDEPEQAL